MYGGIVMFNRMNENVEVSEGRLGNKEEEY